MIDARVLARVAATLLTADDSPVGGGILHVAAESLKATEVREVIAKVPCCRCCVYRAIAVVFVVPVSCRLVSICVLSCGCEESCVLVFVCVLCLCVCDIVTSLTPQVLNLNGPQRSNSASSANAKQIASTLGAAFGRPLPRSESNSALERDREEAKEKEKVGPRD